MKKVLCLSFLFLLMLSGCSKKNDNRLNEYENDADQICRMHIQEENDDVYITSDSNVYLYLDDSSFVEKAIYQSVSSLNDVTSYSYETYEYIKNLYSKIAGIDVDYYETTDSLVLEIEYNYNEIDLKYLRDTLGYLLDNDSLLGSVESLPISVDDFKKIELDGYECEVK